MRYARRRDENEPDIVSAARKMGFKVFYTNELGDLIVQFADRTEIWEVKTDTGKLTVAQCRLRQAGLKAHTIRTVEDVRIARTRFVRYPKVEATSTPYAQSSESPAVAVDDVLAARTRFVR